jgi:hypothetical protein
MVPRPAHLLLVGAAALAALALAGCFSPSGTPPPADSNTASNSAPPSPPVPPPPPPPPGGDNQH